MKVKVNVGRWSIVCMALLGLFALATEPIVMVGNFSKNDTDGWQEKSFTGNTEYVLEQFDDQTVLLATSNAAASAYYRKIDVDLNQTPYLNWSWQVDNGPAVEDEENKSGDDFAARIYVVVDGGALFWRTRALNYVWSSSHSKGSIWDNPYAGEQAKMIAVRDADDALGQWTVQKRNVKEDFASFYGKDISRINGIAIMTDTDDSGQSATARYGDVFFSAE